MTWGRSVFTLQGDSPDSESTAVLDTQRELGAFDWFTVLAEIGSPTGGPLDVYLQREIEPDTWADWVHFPQVSAGGGPASYSIDSHASTAISAIGTGTDATPSPALAENTFTGGHPGNAVRLVAKAGPNTTAGAAISIKIAAWKRRV